MVIARGLPKTIGFENSASASAAEGFKPLGGRLGQRFDMKNWSTVKPHNRGLIHQPKFFHYCGVFHYFDGLAP